MQHLLRHASVIVLDRKAYALVILYRADFGNLLIAVKSARTAFDIIFGNVSRGFNVKLAGKLFFARKLFFKKLRIQLVADLIHMPVLFCAKHVARAAYFQIAHGYFKAGAKLGKPHYGFKPFGSVARKHLVRLEGKISLSKARASAHSSAQLIQL